jgi:sugar/nucleoside kinase (ribokinase family)
LDACVDLIITGRDIVPAFGQVEKLVDDYLLEMGGSSCIFACQTAKLGLMTAGVGCVGSDAFGKLILDRLRSSGVLLEAVSVDNDQKTGLGIALCKSEDRAILTYSGTIDAPGMEKRLEMMIPSARHLHVGSYYLTDKVRPHYPALIHQAKKNGLTVSLDTNWDPSGHWDGGLREILPMVDLFLPNEQEAMAIAGTGDLAEAVSRLLTMVPVIGMKRGKKGASIYKADTSWNASAIEIDVIDAVGAGDSFDAGVVFGLLSCLPLETCLKIGCLCGGMSTRKAGGIAGQIDLIELEKWQR